MESTTQPIRTLTLNKILKRSTLMFLSSLVICSAIWGVFGYQCGHENGYHSASSVMHPVIDSLDTRADSILQVKDALEDSVNEDALNRKLDSMIATMHSKVR